jgi:hypothetical protein
LKHADACDSGRSGAQAQCRVFYGDGAESENRDLGLAGFPQGVQAGGWSSSDPAAFSEYWRKDREVNFLSFGTDNLGRGVARHAYEKVISGEWPKGRNLQHTAYFMRCHIMHTQMNAVGSDGEGYVGAGVYEKTSSRFPIPGSQPTVVAHDGQGVSRQHLQVSRAQIFFAELDVIDTGRRGFFDFG